MWLQKTKHVKSYCTLRNNCWNQINALLAVVHRIRILESNPAGY